VEQGGWIGPGDHGTLLSLRDPDRRLSGPPARSGVAASKGVVSWGMAWTSFGVQVSWQQVLARESRSGPVHARIVGRLQKTVRATRARNGRSCRFFEWLDERPRVDLDDHILRVQL
jgi:hypothetical protein